MWVWHWAASGQGDVSLLEQGVRTFRDAPAEAQLVLLPLLTASAAWA